MNKRLIFVKLYIWFIFPFLVFFGCYLSEPDDPDPAIVNRSELSLYYLALPAIDGPVFDVAPFTYISPQDERIVTTGTTEKIVFEHDYNHGDDVSFIFYAVDTDSIIGGKWLALFNKSAFLTGKEFKQMSFRFTVQHLELEYPVGWLPD